MLPGFNHNLRYKERVFHVQTEDAGPSKGRLVTQVFIEGNLISIQHGDYSAIVAAGGPNDALRDQVRVMMQEQHKLQMKRLVSGEFDDKIAIYIDAPSNEADHQPDDPVLRAMAEEEAPTIPPGQGPHPFSDGVPTQRPAPSRDRAPPVPTQPGRAAPASFPDIPHTPPPATPPRRPITNDLQPPPPRAATPAPVVQTPGLGSRPPGPPVHNFQPPPHTPPERPAQVPRPQSARPGALPLGRNPSQSNVSSSSPLGLGAKPNRDPVLPTQNPSEIPSFRPPRGQSQPRLRNPSNVPLRGDSTAFLAELDREMLRQTPINPPRRGASQSSDGRRPPPPAGAPPSLDRSTVKERPPNTMAEQRRAAASARTQNKSQTSERPAFARPESGPGDTLIDSTIPESLREAIQLRRAQSGVGPLPDGTPPPDINDSRDLPPGTLAHRAPDVVPPPAATRQDRPPAPPSVVRPRTPPPDANTVLEMDARELKKEIEEQRRALKERRAADQRVVVTERSLDEALASYLADED